MGEGAPMGMGSFTWACLWLAVNAPGPDVFHMNQKKFAIPIRFEPARRAEIRELLLYVSRDEGRSWNLEARSTPDRDMFNYYAPTDGSYWFTVAVLDMRGNQEPLNVMQAPVGQKIIVDTAKPVLTLAAVRQGEEVLARWEIREDYPKTETLKLEYQLKDNPAGSWTPVALVPDLQGQATIRPTGPGTLMLRIQMQDQAGNPGVAFADVPAWASAAPVAPPPDALPTTPSGGAEAFSGAPQPGVQPASVTRPAPKSPAETGEILPPVGGGPPLARDSVLPSSPGSPPAVAAVGTPNPAVPATTSPSGTSRGTHPAVQIVNKRQARLEFEVAKFGPSGLGSVEVYVTLDDGQTWERAPADPNATLPLTGDVRGGAPVRGTVMIPLTKEGIVHGYTIVVKNRAGLGKPAPQRGDAPQIRVEVDTVPPEAKLFSPQPDPAKRDTLLLTWEAFDRNLAVNPISLEWAPKKEGPWAHIGAEMLPNSGRYPWEVPPNIPPTVYLRLSVRDTAGNMSVALTSEPVLIDFSEPEVHVLGLDKTSR
jgi:hypothetical protein